MSGKVEMGCRLLSCWLLGAGVQVGAGAQPSPWRIIDTWVTQAGHYCITELSSVPGVCNAKSTDRHLTGGKNTQKWGKQNS